MEETRDINSYLIRVDLLNLKTGKEFAKGYDSVKECKAFINKVKRGHALLITGVSSYSSSAMNEIHI